MICEYAQEKPRKRRRWILIVRVITTVVLVGLLCFLDMARAHVNAMYTPSNMTRQQFDAAARFGAWEQGRDGPVRSFVLETPDATITGRDYASMATELGGPFGKVQLKPGGIVRALALAVLLPFGVVWVIPWLIGRVLARLRRERTAT